jgi:hypothetical protein
LRATLRHGHALPLFNGCPQRGCRISIRRTIEDDVEEDVAIEQEALLLAS